MAHTHHKVDQVGKVPRKHLNLSLIQTLIDEAKILTQSLHISDKQNCTMLTGPAIKLNEVAVNVDWNSLFPKLKIRPDNSHLQKTRMSKRSFHNIHTICVKIIEIMLFLLIIITCRSNS